MSVVDRNIIKTYSDLFEGLSSLNKIELIESLSKSLKLKESTREKRFYESFGESGSKKSAGEIISLIRSDRKFRNKEIKF